MKKVNVLLVLSFLFITKINSYSQFGSALPFLLMNSSPSATAMGDIGVAFNPDDAYNIAFNPAHLGALSKKHNFLASAVISNDYIFDKSDLGFQFGLDLKKFTGLPLNAGIGFLRQSVDLGEFTRTAENGQILGKFQSSENANSIAISASLDYFVEISFGLSYKFLSSTLTPSDISENAYTSSAGALDAGLLLSIPVLHDFSIIGDLKTDIKANIGYSILNIGDEIGNGIESDPLPYNDRIGYSIETDFKLPINKSDFSILKFDWTAETREFLVRRDSLAYSYESPFSRINLPENLILLSKKGQNIQVGYGMRFTVFDTFSYMFGNYHYDDYNYSTSGYEFSTKGIVNFLSSSLDNSTFDFIKKHIEISYTFAEISEYAISGFEMSSLNLKINNLDF